jgi:hypothetical protein
MLGSAAACGTHNRQPFYIGYTNDFGDSLSSFTNINFSENAEYANENRIQKGRHQTCLFVAHAS